MRFVIQRVNHANVKIDGEVVGNIGHGLLILFGAGQDDTEEMLPKYVDKICKMRIFEDENGKTNLSLADVSGESAYCKPVYTLCGLPQRQPSKLYQCRRA